MALPTMPLVALQGNSPSYSTLVQLGQNQQRFGLAEQGLDLQRQALGMRREELGFNREQAQQQLQAKRKEMIAKEVASIVALPEDQWQSAYQASRQRIYQSDPEMGAELPPVYSQQVGQRIKMLATQFGVSAPTQNAPTTRTINVGGEEVTQEWRGGEWAEVGRGARWKPEDEGKPSFANFKEIRGGLYNVETGKWVVDPPDKEDFNNIKSVGGGLFDMKSKTWLVEPTEKTDETTATKNAAALGLEKGTPEYDEYLRAATLPTALVKTETNVNLPDATSSKIVNESYGKADTQRAMMADAEAMISLLDQGLDTGSTQPLRANLAAFVNDAFGTNFKEDLPAAQAFRALSNVAALRLRNPDSGLGLTGNTSDRDLQFLKEAVAGLGNTREANYAVLLITKAKAKRQAELEELKADYIAEKGSIGGFQKVRKEYIDSTPLFTEAEKARLVELGQSGSADVPRVRNDADYDALPSGTIFIDPNGQKRRKP